MSREPPGLPYGRTKSPEPAVTDRGPEYGDPPSVSVSEERHIYTTAVEAVVHDSADETVGHIVMAEWDDEPRTTAVEAAARLDGPAVVLRSSRPSADETHPSWHLWAPTVRGWESTVEAVRRAGPCEHYLSDRLDHGHFYLRTCAKRTSKRVTVAPAPEPVALVEGDADAPLSAPHLTRLRQLALDADRDDLAAALADLLDRETVGVSYNRSHYRYPVEWGEDDG